MTTDTRIIVKKTTRETLKSLKRGAESYDALIQKMITKWRAGT
jgi:predicted CopG family antitoxin